MKQLTWFAAVALLAMTLVGSANAQKAGAQGKKAEPSPVDASLHVQSQELTMTKPTITAKGAQVIMDAITKYATAKSVAVAIAIVDDGGNLVAFKRMDGASLGTIQAVLNKSVSALKLQAPTGVLMQLAKQDVGLALGFTSAGFTILGGAQPIHVSNAVVGAIAVSGGADGDDDDYIKVGLDAFRP
jgi:uncharacterized protein GlcG (DUF336 family)